MITLLRRAVAVTGLSLAGAALLAVSACAGSHTPSLRSTDAGASAKPGFHRYEASRLPAPFATRSANNPPHLIKRPAGAVLHTPPGFRVAAVTTALDRPRWITVAPNDDVFVAESVANRVSVVRGIANGKPTVSRFATGLRQPFGIAFYPNGSDPKFVYIADTDAVLRFPYHNGDLVASGKPTLVVSLPGGGYNQHWTRTIVFGPHGRHLYIGVGSRENVGIEAPPRACIMQCSPSGAGLHVYASGLRNAVGLSFNPVSGKLWAAVNERDNLGDNVPPDYATSIKPGGFYGWPYYYIGAHHDPRMPLRPDLAAAAIVPDVLLEPHCAALSIEWDTGPMFPADYRNDGFVAMHGSWNRSTRSGYEVARIPMDGQGRPTNGGYDDFVWGWALPSGDVWGRPVSVAFLHDGSMLISDDGSNTLWRVVYDGGGKAVKR